MTDYHNDIILTTALYRLPFLWLRSSRRRVAYTVARVAYCCLLIHCKYFM